MTILRGPVGALLVVEGILALALAVSAWLVSFDSATLNAQGWVIVWSSRFVFVLVAATAFAGAWMLAQRGSPSRDLMWAVLPALVSVAAAMVMVPLLYNHADVEALLPLVTLVGTGGAACVVGLLVAIGLSFRSKGLPTGGAA